VHKVHKVRLLVHKDKLDHKEYKVRKELKEEPKVLKEMLGPLQVKGLKVPQVEYKELKGLKEEQVLKELKVLKVEHRVLREL
jgi:hypothetical protein